MSLVQSYKNPSHGQAALMELLATVADPEVPVLSILDLGLVRDILISPGQIEIVITPTYTGCPAMDTIGMDIRFALIAAGYKNIKITTILSPAWTTDWMSEEGKQKLKAYGIAPPGQLANNIAGGLFSVDRPIQCPQCNSFQTHLISHFGSTACKSLYQCDSCLEPFDYFKCH